MASNSNSNILNDTPQIKKLTRGRPRKMETPTTEVQINAQQSLGIAKRAKTKSQSSETNIEVIVKETPRRTRKNKQLLEDTTDLRKKEPMPRRTRQSKLSIDTQIDLANEVVRMQLPPKWRKKSLPKLEVDDVAKEEQVTEVAVKQEDNINGDINNDTENNCTSKVPASKGTKKMSKTKIEAILQPPSECATATNKRSADSTQNPPKIRKISVSETQKTTKKKPAQRTVVRKSNRQRKTSGQGKEKIDAVSGPGKCISDVINIKENSQDPIPAIINSRKTSNSSGSNLSWTKDISSSSTTTCITVRSNDFVRIDNKIPVIQLQKVEDKDTSDSESSSSSETNYFDDFLDLCGGSLNLSTSSVVTEKCNKNTPNHASIKGDVTKALIRLSSMLKNFDMEIMNWIGYGDCVDDETKKYNDNILRVLKEENEVITHCRQIKRILSNKPPEDVEILETKVRGPKLNEEYDGNDNPISKDNVLLTQNAEYVSSPKTPSAGTAEDCDFPLDNFNYTTFDDQNEDDDALSLFAESITGIDSNSDHMPASPVTDHDLDESEVEKDEYIPQAMDTENCTKTKIVPDADAVKINVCEKQNADSTSLHKESAGDMSDGEIEDSICGDPPPKFNIDKRNAREIPNQVIQSRSVISIFQFGQTNKSIVFRGICLYNLRDACKNPRCPYPHVKPNPDVVKDWLVALSEETFLQEYAFVRSRLKIRRRYAMCFVQECLRRGLIRNLIEMAIDFTATFKPFGQKDLDMKVAVLEFILLGLNDVSLAPFEDLLVMSVDGENLLCHVLLGVIASSQNFTRFKHVFVNLTNVMVRHGISFVLGVAGNILERVCILPPEESLLRSVLNIIKNTDPLIFTNCMMSAFEARLKAAQFEWLEEFMAVKNQYVKPVVETKPGMILEPLNVNCGNNEQERYTSPDTTKVDPLLNNPVSEPLITRTVNFTRTCYNNQTPSGRIEEWSKNNDFNQRRRNGNITRPPPPLIPNLFARPLFRPRIVRQISHGTSPIRYRPRQPRNF